MHNKFKVDFKFIKRKILGLLKKLERRFYYRDNEEKTHSMQNHVQPLKKTNKFQISQLKETSALCTSYFSRYVANSLSGL